MQDILTLIILNHGLVRKLSIRLSGMVFGQRQPTPTPPLVTVRTSVVPSLEMVMHLRAEEQEFQKVDNSLRLELVMELPFLLLSKD